MRRFTSTVPARGARALNRAILTHVYDTKMYLKKLFDKRFRRIFSQLSNDVSNFSKIFHFHLQQVQNMLYLKKCIFNIFLYPLDRKLTIFYVGEDIF